MDEEGTIKLAVHVAETGHYFELNCPVSTPVHILQSCIASAVHLNPQDQLLLCADMRLESQRTLASYRLGCKQQKVFLFNRARLLADAPPPSPEQLSIKDLVLPSPPLKSLRLHPLSNVADLPSFESQFCYHFQKGNAIFTACREKFEACRRLFREQQVQSLAIDAAKNNMKHFYKKIEQNQVDFMKQFNVQHKQHAGALADFDRNLEQLRTCKLHPFLVSKDHTTLLDCLNESSLRKQAESFTISHKQLQDKVLQSNASHAELHRNVQGLFDTTPSVDFQRLEHLIAESGRIMEEQQVILQSLRKDMDTVKKLVGGCANHHSSGLLHPHDAIAALGPMYDVHEKNHLPKMEACHRKLEKLLDLFRTKKHEMSVCVHTCMQRVAVLQSSIRDMHNQLSAFSEALSRQNALFSDLNLVRRVGPAYRACLAEVVRRKASMKLYMGQAGQLAENMAKKRAAEITHRDEFLRTHSALLPRNLLVSMGLFGTPSQCVVNIEPYDTNLLDIDMEDLEKYAPVSMFGPHLKGSANKDLLPHDDGGFQEESTQTNFDIEMIEDVSAEIAGTTKLEVENAWLKAEYASAIALLCSIDFDFQSHASNEGDDTQQNNENLAAKRTIEALALKDEHAKHLQSMLKASQLQCNSYKERVRELEQRLSDQYNQLHGFPSDKCAEGPGEAEASGITGEVRIMESAFEHMDEATSSDFQSGARKPSASNGNKVEGKLDGGDELMGDVCAESTSRDTLCDTHRDGVGAGQLQSTTPTSMEKEIEIKGSFGDLKGAKDEQLASLQAALLQMGSSCAATEERLEVTLRESACLREELQKKTAILNDCYMNCAELESNLLLARGEARTNQCLANRKAAEYSSLRASSVKLRGLVERLRHCVVTTETNLSESLQSFADSLSSNSRDDVTQEFGRCVSTLADRVRQLAQKQNNHLPQSASGINTAEHKARVDFLKEQYERHRINKQV